MTPTPATPDTLLAVTRCVLAVEKRLGQDPLPETRRST